jgi:membrane protein YqaA with SNARE-associated domain
VSEDVKRGFIAAIVVVAFALLGGASLYSALIVAGIAFFAGAIVGWGLDRLFPPRRKYEVLRGNPTWLDETAQRGR